MGFFSPTKEKVVVQKETRAFIWFWTMDILHPKETFFFESFCVKMGKNVCVKNVIKMKLKTNTSLLVLYVCYWPGLEDYSSGPGIVSRSLSRGESASLSSKHGFFLAREKSSSTLGVSRTASVSEGPCVKSATTRASDSRVCVFLA